jgi:hypothetical protein
MKTKKEKTKKKVKNKKVNRKMTHSTVMKLFGWVEMKLHTIHGYSFLFKSDPNLTFIVNGEVAKIEISAWIGGQAEWARDAHFIVNDSRTFDEFDDANHIDIAKTVKNKAAGYAVTTTLYKVHNNQNLYY